MAYMKHKFLTLVRDDDLGKNLSALSDKERFRQLLFMLTETSFRCPYEMKQSVIEAYCNACKLKMLRHLLTLAETIVYGIFFIIIVRKFLMNIIIPIKKVFGRHA